MEPAKKKIAKKTVKTEATKKAATKRRQIMVNGRFASKAALELLNEHGFWDAQKREWTEKAEAFLRGKSGFQTERLPKELMSLAKAIAPDKTSDEAKTPDEPEPATVKTLERRLSRQKLFRLTDAERSQIIGKMILTLQSKIGSKDEKSVTGEMIKLLQLEKEFAPKQEEQRPKRVAVVFVPPKEMHKYVLRKDAPRPDLKAEE